MPVADPFLSLTRISKIMSIPKASSRFVLAFGASVLLLGQGCTLEGDGTDVSEYADVIPEPADVKVAGPETAGESAMSTAQADAAAPSSNYARWYHFTRSVREQLNKVITRVIGSVAFVAHTKVTTTGEGFAEWGPFTLPQDTVTWRLRIERLGDQAYGYRLDGRPKSGSEADFLLVLSGTAYGVNDERHGDGEFTIDIDAARTLEPSKYGDQTGQATFSHDWVAPFDRRVNVDYDAGDGSFITLASQANADLTGLFDVTGLADTDAFGAVGISQLEDFTLSSRWASSGAGRADVVIAAGDLSPVGGAMTIAECWAPDFGRVYYSDSLGVEPMAGDVSACALASSD